MRSCDQNHFRPMRSVLRKFITLFLFFTCFCAFVLIYYYLRTGHVKKIMYEYRITNQWDSTPIDHEPVIIKLKQSGDHIITIEIEAPFFNDPKNPGGEIGNAFSGPLWDFEVVELFFHGNLENYLELEFCPHGQHLVLMLSGVRDAFKKELPLKYSTNIDKPSSRWHGRALVPVEYFPPNVSTFNAYAIHGSKDKRTYEALYPTPKGKYKDPDFHRLEYFQPIDFKLLLPQNWSKNPPMEHWEGKV